MTTFEIPERARQERGWQPGDPCASCGSTETGFDPADGATCARCGRTDADELGDGLRVVGEQVPDYEPGAGTRGGPVPPISFEEAIARISRAHPYDLYRAKTLWLLAAHRSGEAHADDFAGYTFGQRNVIGVAVKALSRQRLIETTGEHRKGRSKASHGRRSYVYRLTEKGRREVERIHAEALALKGRAA